MPDATAPNTHSGKYVTNPSRGTSRRKVMVFDRRLAWAAYRLCGRIDDSIDVVTGRIAEGWDAGDGDYGPELSVLMAINEVVKSARKSVDRITQEHMTRVHSAALVEHRLRQRADAAEMRHSGMTYVDIGKRIGVSAKRARDLAAGARD
jgi:hypothetical protein